MRSITTRSSLFNFSSKFNLTNLFTAKNTIWIYQLLFLGPILLSLGCGKGEKDSSTETLADFHRIRVITGSPLIYPLHDPVCQNQSGLKQLDQQYVFHWEKGSNQRQLYTFKELTTVAGNDQPDRIEKTPIAGIYFGFHERYFLSPESSPHTLLNPTLNYTDHRILKKGRPLKICESPLDYSRHSLESVALSTLFALEKGTLFYEKLRPESSSRLRPLSILIHPLVEKVSIQDGVNNGKKEVVFFLMDNAVYSHAEDGYGSLIAIFPQSREGLEKRYFSGIPLWEMPFVILHEWGHHVFAHHFPLGQKILALERGTFWNPPDKSTPIYSILHSNYSTHSTDSTVVPFVSDRPSHLLSPISALSEGFSDLFAFYTLGAPKNLFTKIDCLEDNREVSSSRFINGERKILSREVLNEYFHSDPSSNPRNSFSCSVPNYRDEHIIGAIWSHGIFRLLESIQEDSHSKGKLLLDWLDHINENFDKWNQQSPAEFFQLTLSQFVQILRQGQEASLLTTKQCQIIDEVFPDYKKKWCNHLTLSHE